MPPNNQNQYLRIPSFETPHNGSNIRGFLADWEWDGFCVLGIITEYFGVDT